MARVLWAGVVVMLVGLAVQPRGTAGDAPPPDTKLKIGMLEGMFRDVQPAMVQAMSIPFRAMFERQTGFTGDVEIVPTAETLAGKISDKKLHLGVFHGFEFAQVRARHPELRPLVVTMPTSRTCQACVVVHKDNKAASLSDLAGEPVVVPRGIKAHCLAFIDKARRGLPATAAKPTPKPAETNEDVLNGVSDRSCPAALVDVGAFQAYQNLQPGAAQRLRVLCRSEVFPVSVIAYRKDAIAADGVTQIKQGLIGANQTAQGRPLMMLWSLKGFEDIPADYEAQLESILKAYPVPPAGR